jgi:hypothetical protein
MCCNPRRLTRKCSGADTHNNADIHTESWANPCTTGIYKEKRPGSICKWYYTHKFPECLYTCGPPTRRTLCIASAHAHSTANIHAQYEARPHTHCLLPPGSERHWLLLKCRTSRSTKPNGTRVHMHPTQCQRYSWTSMSTTSTVYQKVTKRNSITETSNRELEKYILYSKWSQDHVTTTHGYLAHHKMCFVEFDPSKIPNFQWLIIKNVLTRNAFLWCVL